MINPLISFIIPHRENESIEKTKTQIEKSCMKAGLKNQFEIISVSGNQPSVQRNQAVKVAKGQYIYFLDNDSLLGENNILSMLELFHKDNDIALIGGPSLTPDSDSELQKKIGAVLSCSFASGRKIKSRYSQVGSVRETDEYELILCNIVMKKSVFLEVDGFKEYLYPNEENVLIHDVKNKGYKVYYHPDVVVYRSQRANLKQFIKQMFTYGRGRADETISQPKTFQIFSLIPVGFVLYVFFAFFSLAFIQWYFIFIPLFLYLGISSFFAFRLAKQSKNVRSFFLFLLLFFLVHFFYGLGMIFGAFKNFIRIKRKKEKIYFKIDS